MFLPLLGHYARLASPLNATALDVSCAKLLKKVVVTKRFWKINAFRPEIKAKRGRTWKFKNRDNAKLGGLVKEIGCQIVTQFMTLGTRKVPLQNSEE